MYFKANSIYYISQLYIHFLKNSFVDYEYTGFNFQNMAYMHTRFSYQIFNYVAYKKKLTREQPNLP